MKTIIRLAVLPLLAIALFISPELHALTAEPLLWWQLDHPGRYINGYNDPDRNIWEVRNEAELLRRRLALPKRLSLHFGLFPGAEQTSSAIPEGAKTQIWLKRPDGNLAELSPDTASGTLQVDAPETGAPDGIYLLGSRYAAGRRDVDGDGLTEEVYLYATFLLRHVKESLSHGGERQTFMHTPALPLEIGPVRAGRFSGIIQIAHRPYEMAVFYRGRPLPDAEVSILTERGWHQSLRTDAQGQFIAIPHETRGTDRDWETYLYVVRHHDRQRGEFHCATLPMLVDPPWPEWSHYTTTFILWALAGTLFAALLTGVLIVRRRRRERQRLARFDRADGPGGASCA